MRVHGSLLILNVGNFTGFHELRQYLQTLLGINELIGRIQSRRLMPSEISPLPLQL